MWVHVFTKADHEGYVEVDPDRSVTDQIGGEWKSYDYDTPTESRDDDRRSFAPLFLVVMIVILGAVLIFSSGGF